MAEMRTLNKQHPLYQEDLKRICETKDLASLYNKRFLISGATGLPDESQCRGGKYHYLCLGAQS